MWRWGQVIGNGDLMEGTFDVALGYQLKIFEIERRNGMMEYYQ